MAKYIIGWSMCGEVEIDANSHDEAQARFEDMTLAEIADTNAEFNAEDPMTEEELDAQLEQWRKNGDSALDNILREEIAQTFDKERSNG